MNSCPFKATAWAWPPTQQPIRRSALPSAGSALERFQDRYTLSALLRGRRSLGSRRLECIPFGYGNPETAIVPGLVFVGGGVGVVAGFVADVEVLRGGAGDGDQQTVEGAAGFLVVGVVGEQVLGAEVVADLGEGLVEAAIADVEALAAGLLGEGDEGVFAAEVAAGAGLDGHVDDGVDHDFIAQGLFESLGVGGVFGGVVAVRDDDEDLAALPGAETLGAERDGVVEGCGVVAVETGEGAVDHGHFAGEGCELADFGGELEDGHLILRAEDGVGEAAGGVGFFGHVLADAAAGVNGQGEVEGQFGLALEDGDLLGAAVFGDGEVVAGEGADDGAVAVSDVDEDVDELGVDMEGGVLGGEEWGEE